jgi:hypothetical protein
MGRKAQGPQLRNVSLLLCAAPARCLLSYTPGSGGPTGPPARLRRAPWSWEIAAGTAVSGLTTADGLAVGCSRAWRSFRAVQRWCVPLPR